MATLMFPKSSNFQLWSYPKIETDKRVVQHLTKPIREISIAAEDITNINYALANKCSNVILLNAHTIVFRGVEPWVMR